MTGGIIPNCSKCNDLGKDPNGCPGCNKLGPAGRKKAKDTAGRVANAKKNQPTAAPAGGYAKKGAKHGVRKATKKKPGGK